MQPTLSKGSANREKNKINLFIFYYMRKNVLPLQSNNDNKKR